MAYIQSYNTNRKKDGTTDAYGGFTTTANAGVSNTNGLSTETGLLKDTGKLTNEQAGGSGRFTNLQNYLDANKPQAVELSQNVGQHIGQEVQQANEALTKSAADYKTAVDQNTRAYDQTAVNSVLANPNANVNTDAVKRISEVLSGSYKGPTVGSTAAFDPAIQEVSEATQAGKNVGNAGGQVALLKSMSTDRPYSVGGYNLNQLLLQNNEQARQNITQAGTQAAPLQGNLTNAFATAQQQTEAAQLANQQAANQTRSAIAGEIQRQEQQWVKDAAAIDAQKSQRSAELINKIASLPVAAQGTGQYNKVADLQEKVYVNQALGKMGVDTDKIPGQYRLGNVEGQAVANTGVDTSAFTDQDLADLGMTRTQIGNLLRTRQRVVDMGGQATDLSQWLAPYVHQTTAAGAATAADAQRYNQLNALIGQAPTQNVTQEAMDYAKADKSVFDTKEAYARMQTEMNTIQAQQQAKWAKEQELRAAQMVADAQRAAAKAQAQATMVSAVMSIVMIAAFAFFSDETLKTDIQETSGDDITRILNDLTKGK